MKARICGPLAVLAAGCAGAPDVPADWFAQIAGPSDGAVREFPHAAAVLAGFDEPSDGARFRTGDRALYGLEFRDGDALRRWTMLLEVVDPAASKDGEKQLYIGTLTLKQSDGREVVLSRISEVLRLRVTRFDQGGAAGASSVIDVPREFLAFGLARGCAAFAGWTRGQRSATDDELRTVGQTISACKALFDLIQEDALLSDVLWQIARTPSVWSVFTHGGVYVSLDLKLDDAAVVADAPSAFGPTYRLPLEISANDEPSLLVVADVVEPRSPWNLDAGVIALTAQRPGDDGKVLRVRLLAARRGPD